MSAFASAVKKWSALIALPIGASLLTIYYAPLPNEKLQSQRLPFSARYRFFCSQWISKQSDILHRARHIEKAYEAILESGLGAVSREATQTLVYLAHLLTECQDDMIPKEAYEEVFHILVMKPHVGEAVEEEMCRYDMALVYADFIEKKFNMDLNQWRQEFIARMPAYVPQTWKQHIINKYC